jgi:hypothetical protein
MRVYYVLDAGLLFSFLTIIVNVVRRLFARKGAPAERKGLAYERVTVPSREGR